MFTGIIEEIGVLNQIQTIAGGRRLKIRADKVLRDSRVNDSIAVNGVCLTVTKIDSDGFWSEAVGATIEKTTLKNLTPGTKVNLERALSLSGRLGGHLVQGHVNGVGKIISLIRLGENYNLRVRYPLELNKYIIAEGSITIDGISLTVAKLSQSELEISVIPHTWQKTNLADRKIGDDVNLETDVIAKYIEQLLTSKSAPGANTLTDEKLKNLGF